MEYKAYLIICLASFCATHAAPTLDLCAGCTMVNGAGYNKHPTDCDKFVQCHYDAIGKLVGEVQQCSFGTEWHMGLLTCMPANEMSCPTDKCIGKADGDIREGVGNCRGYWECLNGNSIAKCCPVGQNYNDTLDACVDNTDDDICTDSCFNDIYVADMTQTTTQKPCFQREVANMPNYYEEEITGWGWMMRPCAIGTEFVQSVCECVQPVSAPVVSPAACKPEIYLPFTHDHSDQSGRGNYVQNENVIIENGTANFNGVNSRLIIPRFTNLESNAVVIKVKYSSKHNDLVDAQAIISNNDCNIEPAIKITEDSNEVTFNVGTNLIFDYQTSVSVLQTPMGPLQETAEKDAVYKFLNGILSGKVGTEDAVTTSAPGHLRKVHCALHVGHAQDAKPFKGEIDELTIYLCDPDN